MPPASESPSSTKSADLHRHRTFEDAVALVVGTLLISLGVTFYVSAGLLTGGISGLAFLVTYLTGFTFGQAFFVLNLPFYWLALRRMGWRFTIKTFIAVALLSVLTDLRPHFLTLEAVHPAYASVIAGALLGTGFLILFRHKASLGGVGILALYLQDRYGWSVGKTQMSIDCVIVLLALLTLDPVKVGWSVLSAVVLNLILTFNHKPGRYVGS